jgi:two-component system cell cycle sensor histidine kinase/response regulator CckA
LDPLEKPAYPPAVLIVDDDIQIRRFAARVVARLGYAVLLSDSLRHAAEAIKFYPGKVLLVITDVVMPGGGGLDLANQLQNESPETQVLYMSGYADSVATTSLAESDPGAVLKKPFSPKELSRRIEQMIGRT